jgi:tRNA-splicing ligase RtcB
MSLVKQHRIYSDMIDGKALSQFFDQLRGKGNPDSLCSSSHGAGRVMGRKEAKEKLDMAIFRKEMEDRGIQARIEAATLDESASAYKDIFEVMAMQRDLVEVLHHVKPIINIKG